MHKEKKVVGHKSLHPYLQPIPGFGIYQEFLKFSLWYSAKHGSMNFYHLQINIIIIISLREFNNKGWCNSQRALS